MTVFGTYLRELRKAKGYSQSQLAARIGTSKTLISRFETEDNFPPSEKTALALAEALDANPDVVLVMAGKVSSSLIEILQKRPDVLTQLLRDIEHLPDHALLRISRVVKDGKW